MKTIGSLGLTFALSLGASSAIAQSPPPAPPPPPRPVPAQAPALQRPAILPPPPAPAPAAAPAARGAPVFAPVRAAGRASAVPDSVRRAVVEPSVTPPEGAVAQCGDGTFIVAPAAASACATRRGVLVLMPRRTEPPPAPVRANRAAPVAARAAPPLEATPPAGATMRCKDGRFLTGAAAPGRCDAFGGTAAVLVPGRVAPAPPTATRRP